MGQHKESQTEEWKVSWDSKHLDTLSAFSNSEGGTMFIGKDDKGKVIGVTDPKDLLKVIPDTIRNKLKIRSSVEAIVENDKTYIKIEIGKGNRYVDLDGVFYKRVGSTTQRVMGDELRSWILADAKMSWVDLPSGNVSMKDLSQDAVKFFVKKGTASKRMSSKAAESDNESLLKNYELMDDKGLRNSATILFRDEPSKNITSAGVHIGEFNENDLLLRHDLIDCPAVMLPDRAMDVLLNKYMKSVDEIVGLMRVTKYPYPEKGLREAVMNSIIHRDYSSFESTYVRVYPDRIEISNPGSLPAGWTEKNLFKKHGSVLTNTSIAKVFFDMGYIEKFGSGIETIRNDCKAMNNPEPEYNLENGRVEIVFKLPEKKKEDIINIPVGLTPSEIKVYCVISEGSSTTRAEISAASGFSEDTVKKAISVLTKKGHITRVGSDKTGKWVKK
ncbi:MAG: putative DNA binding domain-containing protein [Methanomassiliicoccaceae archaeon]|nr:putative DNA binding domain-containing protein [Methanomassiliicoccaceae archaeon]